MSKIQLVRTRVRFSFLALPILSLGLSACLETTIGATAGGGVNDGTNSTDPKNPAAGKDDPSDGTGTGVANPGVVPPAISVSRKVLTASTPLMLDAKGFTILPADPAGKTLYVSSSTGDDANTGLSPDKPLKTVARASNKAGNGDIMRVLFKKGDTWSAGETFAVNSGGDSAANPFVVGSYGTATQRPVLMSSGGIGLNQGREGYGNGKANFVAIVGLSLVYQAQTGTSHYYAQGITRNSGMDGLLIEDCFIQGFYQNVVLQASTPLITNMIFRRNISVDSYGVAQDRFDKAAGLYGYGVPHALIEENIFDNNANGPKSGSLLAHTIYWSELTDDSILRNNIISGAPDSVQLREGGIADNNLFFNNGMSLNIFCATKGSDCLGSATNNVILDGHDLGDVFNKDLTRSWGITINGPAHIVVSNNVIAHSHPYAALSPQDASLYSQAQAISLGNVNYASPTSITLEKNVIYDWVGGIIFGSMTTNKTVIRLTDNDVQQHQALNSHLNIENSVLGIMMASPGQTYDYVGTNNRYYTVADDAIFYSYQNPNSYGFNPFNFWTKNFNEKGSTFAEVNYDAEKVYPDRDLGDYWNALKGVKATDGAQQFLKAARSLSKDNWVPAYTAAGANAYLLDSFGLKYTAY